MEAGPSVSGERPLRAVDAQRQAGKAWLWMAAAAVGGLALMIFSYAAMRWGALDDASLLALGFGLLLLAYAALAVVGVRAGAIAPFVVAALLLPWVCGAAAMAGIGQRVDSVVDGLSEDFADVDSPEDPAVPMPEESDAALPSEEEVFPSPPPDATSVSTLGDPVVFEQELGPGEFATWEVMVKDVECGSQSLAKAEFAPDGSVVTATPRGGQEFCVVETEWTNVGKVEAGGATVLGNLMVGGQAIERQDKDVSRGLAVMDQRDLGGLSFVQPGKTVTQVDVFEVPAGTVPDAVWISRDQPKVLVALK